MFLMDVLRHAGAARLAEFAGATPGNVAMEPAAAAQRLLHADRGQRPDRKAAADATAPRDSSCSAALDAFLAGINAGPARPVPRRRRRADLPRRSTSGCRRLPSRWTRADVVYIASLVGGIFGKGGGHEVDERRLVAAAAGRSSAPSRARAIYGDLREKNDPEAPTTSSRRPPVRRRPGAPTRTARCRAARPAAAPPPLAPGRPCAGSARRPGTRRPSSRGSTCPSGVSDRALPAPARTA